MKPKDYEVIYKVTVTSTVPSPSALNWNVEPIGELIWCKDCRWFDTKDISGTVEPIGYRCKLVARLWREPDDFCKRAERKENDHDQL